MVNKEKILNISKKILAFSLAEVLISMVILSVFIAGTMKVVTIKPKPRKITYPHGFYEVYTTDGSTYRQHYVYENSTRINNTTCSTCEFTPPVGVAFVNVYVLFKGTDYVYNDTIPFINNKMTLIPPSDGDAKIDSKDGDLTITLNDKNNTFDNFKKYLQATNPKSKLLEGNLIDSKPGVIFISW